MAILSRSFSKSVIFTVFAMAQKEMSLSETCMMAMSPLKSSIDVQISEMLLLSCTDGAYGRNSKFAFRKSTSIFSITGV